MNYPEYLDKIYKLSVDSKKELLELITERNLKKNDILQKPGSTCKTIYFVNKGIARIFYYKDDNDITEHFSFTNDIIIRAESLFTGQPTSKGIQVIENTEIMALDSAKLFALYDSHHDIERLFRLIIEREYTNTVKRIESLQFKDAKERYMELLNETDLVNRIPLKYIASYLGITQVSLSRIRSQIN
jgi:CRP-like cAMP-binding protein